MSPSWARTGTGCSDLRDRLAALPAGEFPHIVALAGDLTAPDLGTRFEFALDRLLDGIAALPHHR
ncbi:hypothetical protein [Actinoallomurus sp. NPDC052274]|uniref:hypothetical protein n=1 Tax=Actinoallomurus sp. NPDC052274 TaxID=3155420 RepID=UPI003422BDBC